MSNKRIVRALGTSPRNAGGRNGAGVGADGIGVGNRMGIRMGMGIRATKAKRTILTNK